MIKLAVGIRQLFSSFDPCADSEDRYLYCVHIELAVYVPYVFLSTLSFPMVLLVDGANWSLFQKRTSRSGVMTFSRSVLG